MERVNVGGAGRRKTLSRSGASPEMVDSGVPGAKTTRVWVWEVVRDMGEPLEPKAGLGRCLGGVSDGAGGEPRRSAACRDHGVAYDSKI